MGSGSGAVVPESALAHCVVLTTERARAAIVATMAAMNRFKIGFAVPIRVREKFMVSISPVPVFSCTEAAVALH